MRRIDTPDGLFAPGSPATSTKGTAVRNWWLNIMQEELAGVVEGLGDTLDPNNNGQLLERLLATFADKGDLLLNAPIRFVAGGTGDAITGTLDPAITAYPEGLRVRTIPTGSNDTATPKINLNALGDVTIVKRGLGGWMPLDIEEWNEYTPVDFEYHAPYFYLLTEFGKGSIDNTVINGGMTVDQKFENAGITLTAGAARAQTIDMWFATCTGANVMCGPTDSGAMSTGKCFRFLGAPGVTGLGLSQRITSRLGARFVGKPGYFRIKIANSLLSTVDWVISYANGIDAFSTVTVIASGTFAGIDNVEKEFQVKIPSMPAGAANGLQIFLNFGAQISGEARIGDVKLGTNNKPFHPRKYEEELDDCQFYYWATPSVTNSGGQVAAAQCNGAGSVLGNIRLPRRMRATPAVTISASGHFLPTTSAGGNATAFTGGAFAGQSTELINFGLTGSSGLTAGHGTNVLHASAAARIYADANL